MYTGILLRYDQHVNFGTDLLVHRELAVSDAGLGLGVDTGNGVVSYWLNFSQLEKIGLIAADGTSTTGFKTSNLPILFDGSGDIKVTDTNVTFKTSNVFNFSIKNITDIDTTKMTVSSKSLVLDPLQLLSTAPVLTEPATTAVNVVRTVGEESIVEDEAGTVIGSSINTSALITITTQISGARIYCYTIDTHKNKSFRASILIP